MTEAKQAFQAVANLGKGLRRSFGGGRTKRFNFHTYSCSLAREVEADVVNDGKCKDQLTSA